MAGEEGSSARRHLPLWVKGGGGALRCEGQPCPRKPTNCHFNQLSLQCQLPTFGEPPLITAVEPLEIIERG